MACKQVPSMPIFASRPAASVALAIAMGIGLGLGFGLSAWMLGAAAVACLAGAVWARWRDRHWVESICLIAGLTLAGGTLAVLQYRHYAIDDISHWLTDSPQLTRMLVTVDQPPQLLSSPPDDLRRLPPRQSLDVQAISLHTTAGMIPVSGNLRVQLDEPNLALAQGQTLELIGMLARPAKARNPGEFDAQRQGRLDRQLAVLRVKDAVSVQIRNNPESAQPAALRRWTRSMLLAGTHDLGRVDQALGRALLLGDRDSILRKVREDFSATGTSHHMAVSGMHIAVLGMFLVLTFRAIGIGPLLSVLLITGFVIVYGIATSSSPPVVRAVLMNLGVAAVLLLRRRVDVIQLYSLVTLLILLYSPLDLVSPGFQLSFGTVLGLMILVPATQSWFKLDTPWPAHRLHPRETLSLLPTAGHIRAKFLHAIRQSLWVGTIAWLVTTPLVVIHFHRFCPWTISNSLLLSPVVMFGLIGSMLKIIATGLLPSLADLWAQLFLWPIPLMRQSVHWLSQLPGSSQSVQPPPVYLAVIYYGLLLLPVVMNQPWVKDRFRRKGQSPIPDEAVLSLSPLRVWLRLHLPRVVPAILAIGLLPLMLGMRWITPATPDVRVTILAVGEGSCTLVELPDGRTMLIDAGSINRSDLVGNLLWPLMRYRGIGQIDTLILTSCDFAHFSGIQQIARDNPPRRILISQGFERAAEKNFSARKMLESCRELGIPIQTISAGQSVDWSEQTSIEILWPPAESMNASASTIPASTDAPRAMDDAPEMPIHPPSIRPNSPPASPGSLALVLRHGPSRVLFAGNLEDAALQQMVEEKIFANNPKSLPGFSAAIVPGHGRSSPVLIEWMKQVNARRWICNDDARPSQSQKAFADATAAWPIWHTASQGAIELILQSDGSVRAIPFIGADHRTLPDAEPSLDADPALSAGSDMAD